MSRPEADSRGVKAGTGGQGGVSEDRPVLPRRKGQEPLGRDTGLKGARIFSWKKLENVPEWVHACT